MGSAVGGRGRKPGIRDATRWKRQGNGFSQQSLHNAPGPAILDVRPVRLVSHLCSPDGKNKLVPRHQVCGRL